MGRASNRKKERRAERLADEQNLRGLVCTSPELSMAPTAELLKAAVVYGDEVLLHSPTATMLASLAGIASLSNSDLLGFIGQVAPNLGSSGEALSDRVRGIDADFGKG